MASEEDPITIGQLQSGSTNASGAILVKELGGSGDATRLKLQLVGGMAMLGGTGLDSTITGRILLVNAALHAAVCLPLSKTASAAAASSDLHKHDVAGVVQALQALHQSGPDALQHSKIEDESCQGEHQRPLTHS